jgi:hypothetical protein
MIQSLIIGFLVLVKIPTCLAHGPWAHLCIAEVKSFDEAQHNNQ